MHKSYLALSSVSVLHFIFLVKEVVTIGSGISVVGISTASVVVISTASVVGISTASVVEISTASVPAGFRPVIDS